MNYFKKVGRPTDEEQALIYAIEQLIKDKQIPRAEIPHCLTLDDLLEVHNLLEAYVPTNYQTDAQTDDGIEEPHFEETTPNLESANVDGTKDNTDEPMDEEADNNPITESVEDDLPYQTADNEMADPQGAERAETQTRYAEQDRPNFVSDDYDPFSDEIKVRSYTGVTDKEQPHKTDKNANPNQSLNLEEAEETPVDNINPNTKRKAAEQTANAILKGYAKLAPQPFKWMSKIDENKIEKLAFEGEININLEVSEGTTFDDYMRQTNAQIDEIFEVDEDTLEEIREPLIEVLLEQKLELTPQQRLLMAVVSHLFQMFTVALSLRRQNNRILEYQKRITLMAARKTA